MCVCVCVCVWRSELNPTKSILKKGKNGRKMNVWRFLYCADAFRIQGLFEYKTILSKLFLYEK